MKNKHRSRAAESRRFVTWDSTCQVSGAALKLDSAGLANGRVEFSWILRRVKQPDRLELLGESQSEARVAFEGPKNGLGGRRREKQH